MKMFIGGKAADASDGKVIEVINPATGKLVDTVPSATPQDVAASGGGGQRGSEGLG